MTGHAESYDEWLQRTAPPPSTKVGWDAWVGVAIGLLMIFAWHEPYLGVIVTALYADNIAGFALRRVMSSARVDQVISIAWNAAWSIAAVVALATTDHDWQWWLLLAVLLTRLALGSYRLTRRKSSATTEI